MRSADGRPPILRTRYAATSRPCRTLRLSELIGSDLVLRDITANDSDYEAAIELVRDAFLSQFPQSVARSNPIYATLDELRRRMPGLTVAVFDRLNRPFVRAADRESFRTGLRKAGLPEA